MTTNFLKSIVVFFLKWLAKIYLLRVRPQVIVIAGTTGRHWVKEAIVEALREKNFSVRANIKNFNAEIGLPLSILNLPSGEGSFWRWFNILFQAIKLVFNLKLKVPTSGEFLVLEMAVDRPDNMNYLLSIVKPKAAVFTSVTMIYQENFENLDEIADEYKKLIKALPWNGLTILNFDDERVKNLAKLVSCSVITYGLKPGADFSAKNIKKIVDGQEFKISINNQPAETSVKINRFGNHHIYASLVKIIIKEKFKMSIIDFFSQISSANKL